MAEPSEKEEKPSVVDEGIDVGISRLTEEKIQSVINSVIDNETGARLKTYVEPAFTAGCVRKPATTTSPTTRTHIFHRGQGQTDHLGNAQKKGTGQPGIHPPGSHYRPHRMQPVQALRPVLPLRHRHRLPHEVVRRIIHKLGVTPLYIQDTAHSHSVTMNQMWVKGDEWPDTLQWQEEEAQAEIPDLRIPWKRKGRTSCTASSPRSPNSRPN
jgi:hypothetical protein